MIPVGITFLCYQEILTFLQIQGYISKKNVKNDIENVNNNVANISNTKIESVKQEVVIPKLETKQKVEKIF